MLSKQRKQRGAFGAVLLCAAICLCYFGEVLWSIFPLVIGLYVLGCLYYDGRPKPPGVDKTVEAPESDPASMPRYASRRWARACYFNGVTTIDELNQFYARHPYNPEDPDR
jgi:hypothetical protein